MPDPEKTVFISYRRHVSSFIARAIFMDLKEHNYDVFMDVESIDSGTFDTVILNQIAARAHFLVICTPGTFERCNEAGDWLRREIEYALDLKRNIVPVLAEDFDFSPYQQYLTGKLAELPRYNALPLYHEYFEAGMERLRTRHLVQPAVGLITPASPAEKLAVNQRVREIAEQPPPTQEELSAEGYYIRAFTRVEDDYGGKIADYSKAIHLNPNFAMAYYNRGVVYYHQGNLAEAISDLTHSIELRTPQLYRPRASRGEAYFAQREYRNALVDFAAAYRLKPDSINVRAGLAITLYALGQIEQAKGHWQSLAKTSSSFRNADWVGKELNWRPELVEEARKLIAGL